MLPETELRNGDLSRLVEILRAQADAKYDVVVPASRLAYRDGNLVVSGGAMRFDLDAVEEADAVLTPTDVFDGGVSERLGIPRQYLRRMRETGIMTSSGGEWPVRLLDANVNAWLAAEPGRKFLVRGFRTDDPDETGIARALLSDRFAPIDNLDVLMAALDGVRKAGVNVDITAAHLTENAMRVQIEAPEIRALAPTLLANYRSPFSAQPGRDLPVVHGGFEIRNGETGGASFQIVPRIVVQVCKNGMTRTVDALRQVHLGGRLEEGVIRWSESTQRQAIELVTAKAADAVATFLDTAYVEKVIAEVESQAGVPVSDAAGTIERVAKAHQFSEAEQASILDCFIRSGDLTAGGVMQAVTAAAQTLDSPDRAADLEDVALDVLATAAR